MTVHRPQPGRRGPRFDLPTVRTGWNVHKGAETLRARRLFSRCDRCGQRFAQSATRPVRAGILSQDEENDDDFPLWSRCASGDPPLGSATSQGCSRRSTGAADKYHPLRALPRLVGLIFATVFVRTKLPFLLADP